MLPSLSSGPTVDEVCRGRGNNLNLMRFLAAIGVIYAHAFGVIGRDSAEPVHWVLGLGLGDISVDVFFFISGFLIAKSFANKTLVQFAWARFIRIFPGLWFSTVLLVLVAGLVFSPLPALKFWSRHDTLTYVAHNFTMLPGWGAQQTLPFALETKLVLFNAPLWTLPHELQMYLLLAVIGAVGGLRSPLVAAAVMTFGAVAVIADKLLGVHVIAIDRGRFLYFFFTGAFIYLARRRIVLSSLGVMACVALFLAVVATTRRFDLRQGALFLVLPYLLLWVAFIPAGFVRQFNRVGDYSYGIYIYAFPIQIFLFGTAAGAEPIPNFLLATLIVLPIAIASWHGLESHALRIPPPLALGKIFGSATATQSK